MDVIGIGLFFGASVIAGIAQDGYFDWLLPVREQPPVDPPAVTVVHHTVTVTRRIIRTTPSFVTVFESVPTYITLAAEPYHKIWSLSWTDLLQCFGPFLIFLLFILLMFWWLGHDDTADTAPVDGADSPSPPSSPQPFGAKPSEDTRDERPDSPEDTAHSETSSGSPSSTGSIRIGTGFFRRSESSQSPRRRPYPFTQRPILQPRRISRETATAGQASSAGPAVGQSRSGSGTRNALRDAITLGRASCFTVGASDRVQNFGTESDNVGASSSDGSDEADALEPSPNAATDRLPPYVPLRQTGPNDFNRQHIVDPDASRIIINRDGAQPGDLTGQALSSAPPSSGAFLSDRSSAHQHAQGTVNSADPTTPAVDAAHPRPESLYRSILTPLSNNPQQVLPHSGGVGSALSPISEGSSAQGSHRPILDSPPAAVPDDDSDLIEFSGLEPEQEDNLPGHSIAELNAIQQHGQEAGIPVDDGFRDDRAPDPDLEDGASDGTLERPNRFGSAPQGATQPESSESSEEGTSDEEDDDDPEFEDVLWSRLSSQLLGHGEWTSPPEGRASDQIEDLLITVPGEQQNVDVEDTGDAVGSASDESSDHEDEHGSEDATQVERTLSSESSGQTSGPGLATRVTSPPRTTNTDVPSSQPAASPVTPQRSIAPDEHDELYYATPEAEQRRRTRDLTISRSLAETLSGFAGPAAAPDPSATRSEETNGQEQGASTAVLPTNRSGAAETAPSTTEQVASTETRGRPLYADFMGQTSALRASATSSEPHPSSLPADVWSSQPFPAPDPASATTNATTDRGEETYPLSRRRIAQSHISMQGHTPQRVEDFSSPSAGASQDFSNSNSHGHQENRQSLTLPHPAREEAYEPEMPSVRDVDNNPHFWAPGERSQARRLRELPSDDPRHLPLHESALDRVTPVRDESIATRDFGTPSSPEDGLVQPSSSAMADPFTETGSEPNAPREARGSIAFSVPPLSNRTAEEITNAANGDNVPEAQEDTSQQPGLATSQQAVAGPTTPAERTRADNPVTPNTASSTATQVITSPHSGTVARDCPHWTSRNFCPVQHAMRNPCPLVHDPAKLKRDQNGKVLCSFFLADRCNRGQSCSNSHDMGDQEGSATQQPASTASSVPTQASPGPQAPEVGAGPSRLVAQPVPTAPAAPAQTVQEPQGPQTVAESSNTTQEATSNVESVPPQVAQEPEAPQPADGPSSAVRRNEDEQVDVQNSDQIAVAQDAPSSTRLDRAPAEPASTSSDDPDETAAPHNTAPNTQPHSAFPEPATASKDNSGHSAGPRDATPDTQPDSASSEPATNSTDNGDNHAAAQNVAQVTQTDSAAPESVTASNNNILGSEMPRDPETTTSRIQRDPEELAVQRIMANIASGAAKSMWADDEPEELENVPVADQETQVSLEAQGQQPADTNQNETGPSEIEQEPAAPVVDEFHRAELPEDDNRAGREGFFLASIVDLEELIAEDKRFMAENSGSKDKQMQISVQTKQSGLMARLSALESARNKLLQLRQQPVEGPSRQTNQPQPSSVPDGAASDQPTVRPQEDVNTDQDAKKPKGKEKQTDASLNNDQSTAAAAPMPGQESLWSDTNYVAPPKQKGKGKGKQKQQQQQKGKAASGASTTAIAAGPSEIPQASTPPPAQAQSSADNQPSASSQVPTAAQSSASTPASEQEQVSGGSQASGNTRAATNPQSSSDDVPDSTPDVNGNPETGSSESPNSSGTPDDPSQPESSDTNYRRVNTALIPDYTESRSAQNAVQSLGEKSKVAQIQGPIKDAKPFSWADEFDDTETFTPGSEIKQGEQAPQHQTPISAQDTSGNPPRQSTSSKPEEKSQATSSVQPPSKAEQKLMDQIQRLETKNLNDLAIKDQCLSSGNVSKAKQLQEQDIPYNEASLLQLRANLEKLNPQNPLLTPDHIESVSKSQPALKTGNEHAEQQSENDSAQAPEVQDNKPTEALSKSIWATDTPNDNVVKLPPHKTAASNDDAKQQSDNATAETSDVEDGLPTQSIADSRWANLPDVDLSVRAPRKSNKNSGPSNKTPKVSGSSSAKANGNNANGNGSGSSKGNCSNSNAHGIGSSKGNGSNSNGNGSGSSKGNGNNSKSNGKNNKKKGNGKKK